MRNMAVILLLLNIFFAACASGFDLQTGDLIFQEACGNGINKAIKEATASNKKYNFTHVGIVWINENGDTYVIEAAPPRVAATGIKEYLHPAEEKKCPPVSVVGRVKQEFRYLIPEAMQHAIALIGRQYDDEYDIRNDKYYCSELIYEIFRRANNGNEFFELRDMTFKNLETGEFPSEWVRHFERLGIPIPEGAAGNNPNDMSRSNLIDIIEIDLTVDKE